MAFIYVITNDINGKQYVGKTNHSSIEERFKEHCKDSKRVRCEKRPLYDAMNKYGIEHFQIKELEECSPEESSIKEIYWIGKLDTYQNGYNATLGGDSKKYYDYKKIADKYLELKSQKETAEYFNCCIETVRYACRENGVQILPAQEIVAKKMGKPVCAIDENGNTMFFSNMSEAGRQMIKLNKTKAKPKNISTSIARAITRKGKLYNYTWKYIDNGVDN